MRRMGNNLQHENIFNFGRGRRGLLQTFIPKGMPANYNDKTCRGLGYIIPPTQSQSEENESLPSHSSSSSEWELDVNVGVLLKNLFVNITSINQLEQEKAIEMFELSHGIEMFHAEPWAQQLDLMWEMQFEQRELSTEDTVVQVDVGSHDHPKPIYISESLSLTEREELIALIREYIDVYAWNYEVMPGLDPQIAMHRLNIKPDVKPVKQQ